MKYLLDTNICIHFFRGKYNLLKKIESVGVTNCAISEITLAELVYGAEYSDNPERNLKSIEEFTRLVLIIPIYDSIFLYGKEKARLRKLGTSISDFDLLIGCTSVERDMFMVTENTSEFERIRNIKIENWIKR